MAMPTDWAFAVDAGEYRMSTRGISLETEGFIHCSDPHQLVGVANRFYSDVMLLILISVDTSKLDSEVIREPPFVGSTDLFPHIYGPIPMPAVLSTLEWNRVDGELWADPFPNPAN